ncbi:MAG: hypothetical protein AAB513_02240 [Patescibacteria group bacterium]|mgnify:CR=1 FL=1
MDFIKSEIKNIVIFVAILSGLYFGYNYFFAENTSADPTTPISVSGSGGSVGGEVLPLLLELKKIKLDQSVFNDPIFKKLNNFSTELVLSEGDKGRDNPFAPFEGVVAPSSPQINIGVGTLTN